MFFDLHHCLCWTRTTTTQSELRVPINHLWGGGSLLNHGSVMYMYHMYHTLWVSDMCLELQECNHLMEQ